MSNEEDQNKKHIQEDETGEFTLEGTEESLDAGQPPISRNNFI